MFFFSFLSYKTLREIVTLFFSNFFQSSFSDGQFITFQLFIYKRLNFCYSFNIFSYFTKYRKHLLSFLLIGFIVAFLIFIQSRKSIFDSPRLKFVYSIYNAITEHNRRQKHYLSWNLNYFNIYF